MNPTFAAVCALTDIPDRKARAFVRNSRGDFEVFVVRRGQRIFAYRNDCPHNHRPLEYRHHEFLSADGEAVICFAHGARFDVQTGQCIAGVCEGERLTAVPGRVRHGWVELDLHGWCGWKGDDFDRSDQ